MGILSKSINMNTAIIKKGIAGILYLTMAPVIGVVNPITV